VQKQPRLVVGPEDHRRVQVGEKDLVWGEEVGLQVEQIEQGQWAETHPHRQRAVPTHILRHGPEVSLEVIIDNEERG